MTSTLHIEPDIVPFGKLDSLLNVMCFGRVDHINRILFDIAKMKMVGRQASCSQLGCWTLTGSLVWNKDCEKLAATIQQDTGLKTPKVWSQTAPGGRGFSSWPEIEALKLFHVGSDGQPGVPGFGLHFRGCSVA
jgi:hypothetical protein